MLIVLLHLLMLHSTIPIVLLSFGCLFFLIKDALLQKKKMKANSIKN